MRLSRDSGALDRTFYVGLILKWLNGVVELVCGVALLVLGPEQLRAAAVAVTRAELREDPQDFVANWLVHYSRQFNVSVTHFGAAYLLVHGAVKVLLIAAVLRDRLWAYPWLIGTLVAFIAYQAYELAGHFTWALLLLTLFDVFIVVLTVLEYRRRTADRAARRQTVG